jgi:hypothetical protein
MCRWRLAIIGLASCFVVFCRVFVASAFLLHIKKPEAKSSLAPDQTLNQANRIFFYQFFLFPVPFVLI